MVFILGASSLHHAIETLPKNTRKRIAKRVFTVPGLSCNPNAVNKRKTIQFLLNNCFKSEKNFILWHDVLNNSLSKHSSNRNRPLSCPELLKVLSYYQKRLRDVVYCRRKGVPDIFRTLKSTVFSLNVLIDFISKRKARNVTLQREYSSLHQRPDLELKSLFLVLRYSENLSVLAERSRPKKLNKRRRRALRNRKLVSS